MEHIAAIVTGQHAIRILRIAHSFIEIDYAIEGVAGADPFIHSLPLQLLLWGEVARDRSCGKRGQSGPEDLKAGPVGSIDQLFIGNDHVLCRHCLIQRSGLSRMPDIVDALKDDDIACARLSNDVTSETRESVHAETDLGSRVVQKPVAPNPLV